MSASSNGSRCFNLFRHKSVFPMIVINSTTPSCKYSRKPTSSIFYSFSKTIIIDIEELSSHYTNLLLTQSIKSLNILHLNTSAKLCKSFLKITTGWLENNTKTIARERKITTRHEFQKWNKRYSRREKVPRLACEFFSCVVGCLFNSIFAHNRFMVFLHIHIFRTSTFIQ